MFWVLGTPGHLFNFWFVWIEGLPTWLYKPLGGCVRCAVGQALFHAYWITHLHNYNIIDQLFYPSAGIALVIIYTHLYERIEKN